MSKTKLISTIRFLSLATAALVTGPAATYAAMDPPVPKLDCSAAENAGKAQCLQNEATGDDKVYESAYWKAKNGDYAGALEMAATAENVNDPRILRVTGYATRKLGDVDGGNGLLPQGTGYQSGRHAHPPIHGRGVPHQG